MVLLALLAFQVKHLLCDFVLQTRFQLSTKGYYGHLGGFVHAGCHVLFSVPVLLILTHSPIAIAGAVACEFVIHYHIDWLKARTERVRNWTPEDNIYWVAFGADQFLHQVTYIVIVATLLRLAPA
jgi:hypothetical protein